MKGREPGLDCEKVDGYDNRSKISSSTLQMTLDGFDKLEVISHASYLSYFAPEDQPELNEELRSTAPYIHFLAGLRLNSEIDLKRSRPLRESRPLYSCKRAKLIQALRQPHVADDPGGRGDPL